MWGPFCLWKLWPPFLFEHFPVVRDDCSQDEDAHQTEAFHEGFHIIVIGTQGKILKVWRMQTSGRR